MKAKIGDTRKPKPKTEGEATTKSASPTVATWRIRSESGEVFGPADQRTLLDWARDGRIGPEHTLSRDGREWVPAPTLAALKMDWIAELTPGAFYGPIHQDNLTSMVDDGTLRKPAALYYRRMPDEPDTREQLEALNQRMREQQQVFEERLEAAEDRAQGLQRKVEALSADLKARDLEFESERQDFQSRLTRQEAEQIKREAAIESLNAETVKLREGLKGRHTLGARLADLEAQTGAERKRLRAESETLRAEVATERESVRETAEALQTAETELAQTRQQCQIETAKLRETLDASRKRLHAIQTLLRQALTQCNGFDEAPPIEEITLEDASAAPCKTDAADVNRPPSPIIVSPAHPPAPVAQSTTRLAEIEAQAQRELRALHASGGSMERFLKRNGLRR